MNNLGYYIGTKRVKKEKIPQHRANGMSTIDYKGLTKIAEGTFRARIFNPDDGE
jgi:hypothetical protein